MIVAKYEDNGKCEYLRYVKDSAILLEGEQDSDLLEIISCSSLHKEPYLSEYKLELIRLKRNELLKESSYYISGLSKKEKQDIEFKKYQSDLIEFIKKFKNKIIKEKEIVFPENPISGVFILTL